MFKITKLLSTNGKTKIMDLIKCSMGYKQDNRKVICHRKI